MKIPSEAKCVFKGKIFDVYQWEQKMFDGTYETFEMLKRPSTVCIFALINDKICLTFQSQPNNPNFYSFIGGRGDEGEDALETAKRELLEESGMKSDEWELFKVYQPYIKIDWDIYFYIARNCKKVAEQKLDRGEQIEIREYSFDECIDILLSDKFWASELTIDILRMKNEGTLDEFRKKLFGS